MSPIHARAARLPLLLVAALAVALSFATSAAPAAAEPGEQPGETVFITPAASQTTAAIMTQTRIADAAPPRQKVEKPVFRHPGKRDSGTALFEPTAAAREPGEPLAAQTVSTPNFTAATLADTSAFPPDSMGDIGPTQYILAVNGRIRSFNRSGVADGVINADIDVFYDPLLDLGAGERTSDPRIRFDRATNRWYVIIIDVDLPNRLLVAYSNASTITPSTVWTYLAIPITTTNDIGQGCLFDYPTLGIDASALYVGGNNFCGSSLGTAEFWNTDAMVINKASLISGGPVQVTVFRDLIGSAGPWTPQGVDNFDPSPAAGYFIGVDAVVFNKLVIRRVSNPGGATPTISGNIALAVPTTAFPLNVPHLGNNNGDNGLLDGIDDRLMNAVVRNGRLWTNHAIAVTSAGVGSGSGTRNGVRWYEIGDLDTTPALVQSGTIFDSAASNPRYYWIPSIMVSGQGHVAMGFSTAGTANFVDAATVGRLAGDAAGTVQGPPTRYTNSTNAYNPAGNPGGPNGRRWGDYSYTSIDPNDNMTMWTVQQWTNAANSYAVQVVRLLAPPPATPSGATGADIGATSNVVITGTSSGGSGFYDPGPGFPNRISASVSGSGVTVNSVTYNSPTSVTLNVTVAPGTPVGTRSVTITNPDGQAATGVGILQIADLSVVHLPFVAR